MGSENKIYAEHESDFPCFDNLTITESVNAYDEKHELILESFNNDNHAIEIEKHNHPLLTNDNNYSLTEICSATNVNVEQRVSRSTNKFSDFLTMYRQDYNEEVLNNQQNNNIISNSITSTTTTTMSNKNFVLTFDHEQLQSTPLLSSSASESLLSPAEQPFGRRYAEISQFISHPNVEWTTDDKPQQQPDTVDQSFYDDVDVEKKETVMASCIQKSDDDEDLQMLLINDNLSKDTFFESNVESSESDGGVMAEGEDETSSSDSQISGDSPSPSCDLGLMERLLRTHPVWFLPGLQRGGSVHLLQGKEVGNFIVRGSSQKNTMAISVRLPRDCGPYIEHYLVQSNDGLLNLESSRFKFDSIPALICHYAQCCDELPVQLCLPKGLREAINRQQLMSLALLGSEFWRCPITSDTRLSPGDDESLMKSPTDTSGISTMEMSSLTKKNNSFFNKFNKTSISNNNQQLVETPSDTASSMSSFVVSGGQSQLLSPQSVDNVFINSPTAEFCNLKSNSKSISNLNSPSGIIGKTSTFKTQKFSASHKMLQSPEFNSILPEFHHPQISTSNAINHSEFNPDELVRPPRPTPPCTLNLALAPIRAPAPPKRWSKSSGPTSSSSPYVEQSTQQSNNNFVVTTTVTFNVNKQQNHTAEIEIPPRNNVVPTISERLSPEGGECRTNSDSSLQKWEQLKSPTNPFKPNESVRSKRSSNRRKQSKHYHDSDILESPSVYCRSNLGDKISDYEDLWDPERNNNNTGSNAFISMDTNTSNSSCNEILSPMVISSPRQMTPPPFGSEIAITTNSPMQPKMFVDNNRSPFYSNPVDAVLPVTASNHSTITPIVRREPKLTILPSFHRYSEPPKGQFEDLHFHASPSESEKGMNQQLAAGSLDQLKSTYKPAAGRTMDPIWTIDSSWEFLDKNEDSSENISIKNLKQLIPKIPSVKYPASFQNTLERRNRALNMNALANSKSSTVYKLISKKYPEIALNDAGGSCWQTFENEPKFQRLSSYDNVEQLSVYAASFAQSDDGTLFSEPWDSSQWDSFLPTTEDSSTIHLSKCRPVISEDETLMEDSSLISKNNNTLQRNQLPNSYKVATILRNRSSYKDREILQHPRNKYLQNVGNSVEAYTMELAKDSTSTFCKNIDNFICCTKESREVEPQKVMRNIRQFMNGMKNYLVKHGEKDFAMVVQKARLHLKDDEFLNLDHVLEGVMHRLIILPLREHLYTLLVDFYHQTNEIKTIINGIRTAEDKDPQYFGIGEGISPPSCTTLARISSILLSLQEAELPTEKMQLMMNAVDAILDTTKAAKSNARHLGADDFLPLLVYSVAKCGFISAEIEAEYMWGLLHPSLLTGEVGYYVTTICSAIAVIKTFTDGSNSEGGTLNPNVPLECSVLRIIIPDEYNGSIQTKTIPVRPHTTTKDVCRIIAHKGHITNPQDYGLFKLVDGEETLLMEHDCPQEARINAGGKHCILAYKRIDAKIAWPTSK